MFNQGPTLIILKTTQGGVCGGYTSKNWDGSNEYTDDIDAFVFNMTQRYNCNHTQKAIYTQPYGFWFGDCILAITSYTKLNGDNEGYCYTGKDNHYNIEGDVSPLTNQKNYFTCAQLEVYKVVYN